MMNIEAQKTESAMLISASRILDVLVAIAGSALGWWLGEAMAGGATTELWGGGGFYALTSLNFMLLYLAPSVLAPGVKRYGFELLTTTVVTVVWYLLMMLLAH